MAAWILLNLLSLQESSSCCSAMGQVTTQPGSHTPASVSWVDTGHFFNHDFGFYRLKSLYPNPVQRGESTGEPRVPQPVI